MELSDKDAELIAGKVVDDLRSGLLGEMQAWVVAQQKNKFEITFGINCEDEAARRKMRKTVEFGERAHSWFESDQGQRSMEALSELAKMLGTEEGAEKIDTLKRFASVIAGTEKWIASRMVKAIALGILALAFIGLQSGEAMREMWKSALRSFVAH